MRARMASSSGWVNGGRPCTRRRGAGGGGRVLDVDGGLGVQLFGGGDEQEDERAPVDARAVGFGHGDGAQVRIVQQRGGELGQLVVEDGGDGGVVAGLGRRRRRCRPGGCRVGPRTGGRRPGAPARWCAAGWDGWQTWGSWLTISPGRRWQGARSGSVRVTVARGRRAAAPGARCGRPAPRRASRPAGGAAGGRGGGGRGAEGRHQQAAVELGLEELAGSQRALRAAKRARVPSPR